MNKNLTITIFILSITLVTYVIVMFIPKYLDNYVYKWTEYHFNASEHYEMPDIKYTPIMEIRYIFLYRNRKVYAEWFRDYGEEITDDSMNEYLSNVVALYDVKTTTVYVHEYIRPKCERYAFLAHEFTHYLQDMYHGKLDKDDMFYDMLFLEREREAYKIQNIFINQMCRQR